MDITAVIALLAAVSGIVLGWIGGARAFKQEVAQEAGTDASLKTDMTYIKRGIDNIQVDLRLQGQRMDGLSERITRLEESSKQAHKRLDRMEGQFNLKG